MYLELEKIKVKKMQIQEEYAKNDEEGVPLLKEISEFVFFYNRLKLFNSIHS